MFEISPLPLPKYYPVTTKAVQVCLSTSYEEGGEKSQTLSCNNQSCPGLFKYFIGRGRGEISNIVLLDSFGCYRTMFEISPLPLRMKYLNKPGQLWLLQDNI
jgi:hypothetical protein